MSLNWNGTKVQGWKEIPDPERDAIIWLTMAVDIGNITEKNWREFAYRLRIYQELFGAYWTVGGKPEFVTDAHVKRMVGLTTNVSDKTRTQWSKRMMEHAFRDAEKAVRYAEEKATKEPAKEDAVM